MVVLRIELSTARLSAEHGQPALNDLASSRAPRGRTENLLVPNQACSHLHLCPYVLFFSSPYGNRTHLSALRGRYPPPLDERAGFFVPARRVPFAQWNGSRSSPRPLYFRQTLNRLSYASISLDDVHQRKKPDVLATSGFASRKQRPSVTSVTDTTGADSLIHQRRRQCIRDGRGYSAEGKSSCFP